MYKVGIFLIAVMLSCATRVYAAQATMTADGGVSIKCDDMSEDGVASAYAEHTFYLDNAGSDAVADYWLFYLKNTEGEFEKISKCYGETFVIDEIKYPVDLLVNSNSQLEGRIDCTYLTDKEDFNTMQLPIFLDMKPVIISIDNLKKDYISLYDFYLSFSVNYRGAISIRLQVQEDDGSPDTYHLYQSPVAKFTTGLLSNLYSTRVTMTVENRYGSAQEMLEFAPEYENGGVPPVVDMTFEYLDTEGKGNEIRLYFSDLERVDRLIIEILKDGVRVPTKTEIMDLEKGFFDRTIYRGTTFTAVAYNENGSTRGTPLYVPFRSSSGVETVEDAGGEIVRVTVYDMSGRVMFDGTPESFATGQLSPGLYVKNEVLKEGVNRTSKIVVR